MACDGQAIAVVNKKPTSCYDVTDCQKCDFYNPATMACNSRFARKKWANSEYIEPPVDWSKVAVDTPILVRNSEKEVWEKRHFAKYENGIVYAWVAGETSWSADSSNMTDWKMAKLAESEE